MATRARWRVRRPARWITLLAVVLPILQTDPILPGKRRERPPEKDVVCYDCNKRVRPVRREDGTIVCPNGSSHVLGR